MKKTTIGKEVVYKVKPNNPSEMTDYIILRLTPSGRIHRITVYSREMKSTQCEIAKSELRRNVEKKHPNLGYYA
ncbi:MAG: hypothetical protein OEY07_21425, partial [Gammaproteobacteria bacterium]|nr:hypothetical protein [Gammaproteobacteria bacterium]